MKKYPIIATVCRYVLETKQVSNRAIARTLGIHHSTWLRYCKGSHRPVSAIKYKLVLLMRARNFEELIQRAFRHYYPGT